VPIEEKMGGVRWEREVEYLKSGQFWVKAPNPKLQAPKKLQ
jgi:hypothetical protein